MSLVVTYKDYIDFINNIAQHISNGAVNQSVPPVLAASEYIRATGAFTFELLKSTIHYFVTLHWLRDFVNLPILLPKLYDSLYLEKFIFNSSLDKQIQMLEFAKGGLEQSAQQIHNYEFAAPLTSNLGEQYLPLNQGCKSLICSGYFETLDFWEESLIKDNKFIIGFFNSFFLVLPFSVSQIINARRLLVQGRLAGISSISGTLLGQWLFLLCVIYGFRWPLLPLLDLQPFFTIFSIFFLVNVFYQMWRKIIVNYSWSTLYKYFGLNLFLAWTEQTAIFQYLTQLNANSNPSVIEVTTSKIGIQSFQLSDNFIYLFGIGLGQIVFAFIIWQIISALYNFVEYQFFKKTPSFLTIRTNRVLVVILLTMNIMIVPFYGIDYWVTNPLGFASQDKTFWYKTYIPGEQYRKWRLRHPNSRRLDRRRDEARKERGLYLSQYQRKLNGKRASESFEKLNYGAENAWYRRRNTKQAFRRRFVKTLGLRTAFAKILTGKDRRSKNTPEGRKAIAVLIEARVKFLKKQLQKTNKFKLKYQKTTLPNLSNPLSKEWAVNDNLKNGSVLSETFPQRPQNSLDRYSLKQQKSNSKEEQIHIDEPSADGILQIDKYEFASSNTSLNTSRHKNINLYAKVDRLQHKFRYYPRKSKLTKLNWYTFTRRGFPPRKTRVNRVRQILNRNRKLFYYYQPVTQLLLNTKIDTFLARQPKTYLLKNAHEKSLFQRRVLLSRYYDSLLDYSKLASYFSFTETTGGARTFAHRAYKHQFKGTLRVVRRLFSINYKQQPSSLNLEPNFGTEQQNKKLQNKEGLFPNPAAAPSQISGVRVLQFDQPLYTRKSHSQNPILHEELELEQKLINQQSVTSSINAGPLLTDTKPAPYYAGWDEDLREFYITNRYIPKSLSSKLVKLPNWDESTLAKEYNIHLNSRNIQASKIHNDEFFSINFQFWPISPNDINWFQINHSNLLDKSDVYLPDSTITEATNENNFSENTTSNTSLIDNKTTTLRPYYMSVFPVERFKDRFVDKESVIQQFGLEPELSPEEEQRINIILQSSARNKSYRKRNSSSQSDQSNREQQKQERTQEINRLIRLKWKQRGFNYKTVPTTVLKVGAKEPSFKGLAQGGLVWPGSYKPPRLENPVMSKIYNFLFKK
uniref:Hypothetical chloroplast RF1 n=1 Tax=Pleurastrum terricola TaxID=34116 RepID=A6YG81_PLETE|nr:hypothetical chloroplast RF1 [Pleurastrum terricola]ABO69301.1 hypothetical chloroplast RF1 [Pleurastrum terricola]